MQTKNLQWKVLVSLLFFGTMLMASEPGLKVVELNGAEQTIALKQIGRITFENGVMYLYDHHNQQLGFSEVNQINRIEIDENATTGIQDVANSNQLHVFADPSLQQIVVFGAHENQTLRVYDTSGRLMMSTNTQPDQTRIDVNGLPNGTYLLQIGAQVVKFLKQ